MTNDTTPTPTIEAPRANVTDIGSATPLAKVLQAAAEARHAARSRIIGAVLRGEPGKAQEAQSEGQRAIVSARGRAAAAARATVVSEQSRLFGINLPYARQDLASEAIREGRIERRTAPLSSDAEAVAAIGQALQERNTAEGHALAGGIAQHALRKGWDEAVGMWCQPLLGGGSRGGWGTVRSIRAALAMVEDLAAGRWPGVLQDVPTVEELTAEMRSPRWA